MSMAFEDFLLNLRPWFLSNGIRIIVILAIAVLIHNLGKIFIRKAVKRIIRNYISDKAEQKREDTLIRIFSGVFSAIVWIAAILIILPEFGINIGALLAGVGIVGIAVGFGAQSLVKDFFSGLFIIMENQYRIGDVVCFDGTCGLVQEITLRKTILRDLDGVEHHVPNGQIKKASNLSKDFSRVNLNIGIAYNSNLEKVIKVINKIGKEMAEDTKWKEDIIKPPQFLRVDDFADSAIIIKILGETKPLKQWDVAGELRKRLKIAFDKEKIEIPFPQISVWPRGNWEKQKQK